MAADKEAEAAEDAPTDPSKAQAQAKAGDKGKDANKAGAVPPSPSASAASPTAASGGSGSGSGSAGGALNLQSLAAAVDAAEQLSPGARARLSGLAFECLHTVKSRFLELQVRGCEGAARERRKASEREI